MFDYKLYPGKRLIKPCLREVINPLISIITPFYNSGEFFEETFNSVINQTFPYYEWIIVDDGSDNSLCIEKLNELSVLDSRIKVIRINSEGAANARNIGVNISGTDILFMLDADDLIDPIYLEAAYFVLMQNPEVSWVYSDSVGFGNLEYIWKKHFSSDAMKKENLLTVTAAIRKKDFLQAGGYSKNMKNMFEDWAFWLKMLAAGKYPAQINQPLFWYRRKTKSALSDTKTDKQKRAYAKKVLKSLAKDVPSGMGAVTFSAERRKDFQRPAHWNWGYTIEKENKTNILLLIPHMEMGGADKFNLDFIANIDRNKFAISIITTILAENQWRQLFKEHTSDIFELPNFLDRNDWAPFIQYFIKSRNINIVLNSNSYYGYYIMPWLRKEFPDVVLMDYMHMEEKYWRAGGYPRISGACDSVIEMTYTENGYTRKVMSDTYYRSSNKLKTIYLGVDEDYFNPELFNKDDIKSELGIPLNCSVVLFLCRIAPQKRPFLMLEIAKRVAQNTPDIRFLVVGDGPQYTEFAQKIKALKLEDYIILSGRQEDTRKFYAVSDISLICSIKEGLTVTTFESLSMKVPVISSDVGGQSEVVNDSVGMLLPLIQDEAKDFDKRTFPKQEVDMYFEAISELLKSKEKLKVLGMNGRNLVKQNYTIGIMIENLTDEFIKFSDGFNREDRLEKARLLSNLNNLPEEIITLYNEYEANQIYARKAHIMLDYIKSVLTFKKSPISVFREVLAKRNNPHVYRLFEKIGINRLLRLKNKFK